LKGPNIHLAKSGWTLVHYKTRNDREIDFVLKNGYKVAELIQVAYTVTPEVEQREVKALVEAAKELDVTNLTLLTWDDTREVEKDGLTIQLKSLWEWLLSTV
jgi:predicted AAA+ superfamily ATPase